ncbi:TetR/AcrR family transcriptional regulator [Ktedonospora formicarum]|uniref:TetR family transcriptional regulator n=1 Tax=Ktedonospora formicarum TaxID=2778364 RepID=A0A8J3IFE9_9CHLR|nr:TetR/AcrR family transcriptional regulator [Ktedonospora formicarum]GHO50229.1 TetR family transcriptional regulator [Ktedonospora formicarum]
MRSISNRDYVVKVVSELYRVRGFANTSMDDVVKHSGVSKSNIYYHFKSKDELSLAVLDGYISSLQGHFQAQVLQGSGSLEQKLTRYTNCVIDELIARDCSGGCPLLSLVVEAGKTNEQLRQRLAQAFQKQSQRLEELFDEGKRSGEVRKDLSSRTLASLFISWLEGSLMVASVRQEGQVILEERDALLALMRLS